MKKTLLIILILLPIILVVVVAVAGFVAAELSPYTPVEGVEFIDKRNNVYTPDIEFKVDQKGGEKLVYVRVSPGAASDRTYTVESSDPTICAVEKTVDSNGAEAIKIKGIHYGSTTVVAKTKDGGKVAVLNVKVTANEPFDVKLSHKEVSLIDGQTFQLSALVDAPVAMNKNVVYTSSDENIVKIDATGKITAVKGKEGTATITVTTVSGNLTDTCTVTVVKGVLPIEFNFDGLDIDVQDGGCTSKILVINLRECLRVRDDINIDDVKIYIVSGNAATLSDDGILTFDIARFNSPMKICAYVGSRDNPTESYELNIVYRPTA